MPRHNEGAWAAQRLSHKRRKLSASQATEAVQITAGEWRLFWRGQLHPASWNSKGAAESHAKRCDQADRRLP